MPDSATQSVRFEYAMRSDAGRVRAHNEDFCIANAELGVFAVCDGMGGAAAGEIASRVAAETLVSCLQKGSLLREKSTRERAAEAIVCANRAVYSRARSSALRGMGTTVVALFTTPCVQPSGDTPAMPLKAGTVTVAHVGDSRCYRLRGGQLQRLTADHSLVAEQIRIGDLTEEQAASSPLRNVITRAVGTRSSVEPEIVDWNAKPGDLYLLCSDGLTRDLTNDQISVILQHYSTNLDDAAQALLDEANDHGGEDNITCLLVRCSV